MSDSESKKRVDEILKKYGSKIDSKKYGSKIDSKISSTEIKNTNYSQEYIKFKDEMSEDLRGYEKWANSLGKIIKIKPSKKDEERFKKSLIAAHVDVEPWQAAGLSVMCFALVFLFGLIISIAIMLVRGGIGSFPFLFFILVIVFSIFLYYFVNNYPDRLANKWRLKASSQMVPAILYIVVYMRHTSNLEKAIAFASEHLQYPLALDFKKIFYNVEIGKFSTIKESLDNYLETWRDYSTEFIESFHLIEGSLFEPDDARRIATLEKALQVVLDGVYDRMLKFTHSVRSPLTNVYMLGVVLPTLGLALLPLASAMIGGGFSFVHVFIIFNLIVPFFVFYLTDKVLMLRPGGHGDATLLERNPLYYKYKSNSHYFKAFFVALPFIIIGLLPLIFQYTPLPDYFGLKSDFSFSDIGINFMGDSNFFDFIQVGDSIKGPFGFGALLLGMFFPLGIAIFFSTAYNSKTKELIKSREKTNQLEQEFNNSLFNLGNRLGNNVPPEVAFGKVAESSKGLVTEDFFMRVNYNVQQMGMSVEKAVFEPKRGAINYYPSDLIATSMRVLIESAKKGLKIAAISLMSISEYVKNINKITTRLKDMLAEIISDMRSNMTFLAPLLSGVVVGLAAMITSILERLRLAQLGEVSVENLGGLQGLLNIFDVSAMIPPYYLQISVGIYLIEIIFILTGSLVVIDSGEDKLEKINKTGFNLRKGIMLYFIVALVAVLALSLLSAIVLGNLTG
jgi:hypothetical protein